MNILYLAFLFLLVVLETTLFPMPLTITMVAVISMVWGYGAVFLLFFLGIFHDTFALFPWGTSSAYFLIVCVAARRYQRKLHIGRLVYALMFIAGVTAVYEWAFFRTLHAVGIMWSIVLGGVMLLVINRFASYGETIRSNFQR